MIIYKSILFIYNISSAYEIYKKNTNYKKYITILKYTNYKNI